MKKTCTFLAILVLTLSGHAASVDWTLSMGRNGYIVDVAGEKFTGDVFLVLTDTLSSISTEEASASKSAFETALASISLDSNSLTDGAASNPTKTATNSGLIAPTSYSFSVVIYDAVAGKYYTAGPQSQKAYNLSGDEYTDPTSVTYTASQLLSNAATRGTASWSKAYAAVPEPSSAALALAGLALLLKRRRA